MPLSAAERAKRYRKKNKDVVTNMDNLYRKVQRLNMKVMDPIKNAERLKNRELPKLYTVKKKRGNGSFYITIIIHVYNGVFAMFHNGILACSTVSAAIVQYKELV